MNKICSSKENMHFSLNLWLMKETYNAIGVGKIDDFYSDIGSSSRSISRFNSGDFIGVDKIINACVSNYGFNPCRGKSRNIEFIKKLLLPIEDEKFWEEVFYSIEKGELQDKSKESIIKEAINKKLDSFKNGSVESSAIYRFWQFYALPLERIMNQLKYVQPVQWREKYEKKVLVEKISFLKKQKEYAEVQRDTLNKQIAELAKQIEIAEDEYKKK